MALAASMALAAKLAASMALAAWRQSGGIDNLAEALFTSHTGTEPKCRAL